MDAIKTVDLTKAFSGSIVVDRLNFSVFEGEIFGLVGPDGAGKTTTMRMLASILDPTSGYGDVLGYSLAQESEKIKASIGYMSQRFGLYPDLSVLENMDFYADIYNVGDEERMKKQEELLHFSGLAPFKNRLAAHLSGGMKQKLGLACALIHSPRLVLLDEPTNGVDPVSRRDFWNILKALQTGGMTILMTTSYLDEAEKCDRIGLMSEGKLLMIGTLDEMRKKQKGILIEIVLLHAREDVHRLEKQYGRDNLSLFGNKAHLQLDSEAAVPEVRAFLAKEEIKYSSLEKIDPSLEDIFIEEVKEK